MDTHETGTQVIRRILVDIFNISQKKEGAGYRWILVTPIPQFATNKETAIMLNDAQGGTTCGTIDEASRSSKAIYKCAIKNIVTKTL